MEFAEVVRRRRMIRSYDPDRGVDRAVIASLLELALRAPSAGYTQGWRFVVLDDVADRARFWSASQSTPGRDPDGWLTGMRTAPVLILALSDKDAYLDRYAEPDKGWTDRDEGRWPVPYWDVDTGMACMILLLAALDRGLASCFFGVPATAHEGLRSIFGIPEHLRFVGVVSLGYGRPNRRSASLKRGPKPFDEVVTFGPMG